MTRAPVDVTAARNESPTTSQFFDLDHLFDLDHRRANLPRPESITTRTIGRRAAARPTPGGDFLLRRC